MKTFIRLAKPLLKHHEARCLQFCCKSLLTNASCHRVLVSKSKNIHDNLAMEDWLFENTDLERESVLLLWRDEACVVFGRHQNPWVECNVPYCQKYDIKLARRKSGGGTVYHDEGNVNCSFITHRSTYNRESNLRLIVQALKDAWNLPLTINCRDDILLHDKYKISGTAARLTRNTAYHHFTLLLNIDKIRLKSILHSNIEGVQSKATASVRMSVANLADHIPDLQYDTLLHVIAERYTQHNQGATVSHVDPADEGAFSGIFQHVEEFTSRKWIFDKTPPFSIERSFTDVIQDRSASIHVSLEVKKGHIHNTHISVIQCSGLDSKAVLDLRVGLEDVCFHRTNISDALSDIKMTWISTKLYDVETHQVLDWLLLCVMETTGLFHVSSNPNNL